MTDVPDVPTDPADDLRDLAPLLRALDPVPEAVRAGASLAWGWRTIDVDLAALAEEGAEELTGAGVRSGAATAWLVRFEAADFEVEVERDDDGTLLGAVSPATTGSVRVLGPEGELHRPVTLDGSGAFGFGPVRSGPIAIEVTLAGTTTRSDWVLL